MTFNYFVDPGNQFSHGKLIEQKMVDALLADKKVIVEANYNERLLQKMMIEKMTRSPDVFVLGSSHIMALTQQPFNTESFFNAGVSSASLEDDIALYYLLHKKGFNPKILVICLDPWIVSKSNPEILWKTEYAREFEKGRGLLSGKQNMLDYFVPITSFFEKYSQLLSSDYLGASINKLRTSLHDHSSNKKSSEIKLFSNNDDICQNCFVRLPTGTRLPTRAEEATTPAAADLYVMNNVDGWQNFWTQSELDSQYAILFESFIQYLKTHQTRVVFYFPPLEPLQYMQLVQKNKNYQMVLVAQKYFEAIAQKYSVEMVGSYNPHIAGVATNDFIDSWHMKEQGFQKIFAKKMQVYNG